MATIALLAGTLAGATARVRSRVRGVTCLGHLRQWGMATALHLADHDDHLPHDGAPNGISTREAWYVDLPRALGIPPYHESGPWRTNPHMRLPDSVWICPNNPRRSNGRMLFHYSLNRRVNGSGDSPRVTRISQIPDPSGLVWIFDNGRLAAVAAEGNAHTNAHGNGAQFLFLDGHARRISAVRYWDHRRNRALTNPISLRWFP